MTKEISPNRFFGLHAHTSVGSPFDGLGKPEEHFEFVMRNGGDGLAITEHGNMNSFAYAYQYYEKLKKEGRNFKFIPGIEFYHIDSLDKWRQEMKEAEKKKKELKEKKKLGLISYDIEDDGVKTTVVENEDETKSGKKFNPLKRRSHLIALPKSESGLQSLFNLVSYSFVEGQYFYPRIDTKSLKEIGKDIILSTACIGGPFARVVFNHQTEPDWEKWEPNDVNHNLIMKDLENLLDDFVDAVGKENFFLELQFNRLPAQHLVNKYLLELSNKTKTPLIATADSHYPKPELWQAREMYRRLGWLGKMGDDKGLPENIDDLKCELYPKNADQMWDAYKKYCEGYEFYSDQEICNAIERSYDIAYEFIGETEPDKKIKLPSYAVPKGESPFDALVKMCKEGLKERGFSKNKKYVKRMKEELRLIKKREFSEYFLTKKAIIDIAKNHMLVGFGRGSAASSLVCYCLGITGIDPIKYDLLFSRFLSEHRKGLPDIDSDFSDRDKLLDLLREEFGSDNVIAISNYNTLGLKSLIKDISKYHDIDFQEANMATKFVEKQIIQGCESEGIARHDAKIDYDNAIKFSPEFKEFIENHPEVANFAQVLSGQLRSIGKHAGGVVISENILERMPVIVSKKTKQTPWVEAQIVKQLEPFGWVKFDLLGLETLKIIERCIARILQRHENIENPTFDDVKNWYNKNMSLDIIDLDDQFVYEHIYHKGNYAGVFQCTNTKTQRFFKRAKPISIVDIAALTSIYRPGPLSAQVDKIYVEAKNNPEHRERQNELIENVLKETYGQLVFQEQAMKLGTEVGGVPEDEADIFRKIVSKKPTREDPLYEQALEMKERFISGSIENGVGKEEAESLYKKILDFAEYSFNKSHAISYGINSYLSAWLLTYYEPEWLCAYMETQSNNPDDKAIAISEIKSFGYEIVPIDINKATENWTIVGEKKLMPSLVTCKGVGLSAVSEIKRNRPYKNIQDFLWKDDGSWKHSKANKRVISALIKAGVLDSLDCIGEGKIFASRKQMHDIVIENWIYLKKKLKKDNFLTQCEKIENIRYYGPPLKVGEKRHSQPYSEEEWTKIEKIKMQMELLGEIDLTLLVKKSILDKLSNKKVLCIDQLPDDVKKAAIWCIPVRLEPRTTKSGNPYLIMDVIGITGKTKRIRCWEWNPGIKIDLYKPYAMIVEQNNWGCSTKIRKVRRLEK